jgi:hypothetical protein
MSKYLFNADFRTDQPLPRPKAVYVHCQDCRPGQKPGTCTMETCELHPWRSEKIKRPKGSSRTKDIRRYCLGCQGGNRAAISKCDIYDCTLWPHRSAGSLAESIQIQIMRSKHEEQREVIPKVQTPENREEMTQQFEGENYELV